MNSWISADLEHNPGTGLGKLGALGGVQNWTSTAGNCCSIGDVDVGDYLDVNDEEGSRAEAIVQEDIRVAAAHFQ